MIRLVSLEMNMRNFLSRSLPILCRKRSRQRIKRTVEGKWSKLLRLLAVHFSLEVCAGSRIEKWGRGRLGTRGQWRARRERNIVSPQSLLVHTPIFARAHGIKTRRILREKGDCKQSKNYYTRTGPTKLQNRWWSLPASLPTSTSKDGVFIA